jgi:cytochrome c oxidase cbb3-type subunit 3
MSDFTSEGWGVYVAVATLLSIIACGVLLYALGRMRVTREPGQKVETTGHVWDGDLAEYNNPLPRWWMWLFYATIAFALVYLALYPGLGKLPGAFGWTSSEAYSIEIRDADARLQPLYAKYLTMDPKLVATDPEGLAMGERLFLNYCSQCHGSDAGGSKGFPNLRDTDWLYGGEPQAIKASITDGRNGVMPPFGAALSGENIRDVVQYVRSLSGLPHDGLRAQLGKPVFAQNCAACHGVDGKGSQQIGAPNLTDRIWLYGSTEAAITESVTKGRGEASAIARMPAHKERLDEGKIQLLTAYVWSLSNGRQPPAR